MKSITIYKPQNLKTQYQNVISVVYICLGSFHMLMILDFLNQNHVNETFSAIDAYKDFVNN